MSKTYSLGEILLQMNAIRKGQIQNVLLQQARLRDQGIESKFGALCVDLGYCTQNEVEMAIAEQGRLCLKNYDRASDVMRQVRLDMAQIIG
jgi:hypothetical protein